MIKAKLPLDLCLHGSGNKVMASILQLVQNCSYRIKVGLSGMPIFVQCCCRRLMKRLIEPLVEGFKRSTQWCIANQLWPRSHLAVVWMTRQFRTRCYWQQSPWALWPGILLWQTVVHLASYGGWWAQPTLLLTACQSAISWLSWAHPSP